MTEVVIVRTGTANLASMVAALQRAGASPRMASSAAEVTTAQYLVVPGVGTFGAALRELQASGVLAALRARLAAGAPTLAVCVGLQILCSASEESPGVAGLGLVDATVRRFTGAVRVPQLGWRRLEPGAESRWVESGAAYFANSYRLSEAPAGWQVTWAEYGGRFVAAMERGNVLACQFHPELSGGWGQSLIARWLSGTVSSGAPIRAPERLAVRLIPCLDVDQGRVVKGVRFAALRDAGAPAELAASYAKDGADELALLDVSATPLGRRTRLDTVREVRARIDIPLTVGGGVRSADDAACLLEAGADKVAVNTSAVCEPALLTAIAERFGRQCAVLSLDAAARDGSWEVVVESGRKRTGRDAILWAREAVARGAGEILLTSFDRDGTRSGYDLRLIHAVAHAVEVPIIASGGAGGCADLAAAVRAGADAVLAASIFHDRVHGVTEVKTELSRALMEVPS